MALITKNVGTNGDYATWYAVQTFLAGAGNLTGDDYTFTQISDITETNFGLQQNSFTSGAPQPTIIFDGNDYTTTTPEGVIYFGVTGFDGWIGIAKNMIIKMTYTGTVSSRTALRFTQRTLESTEFNNIFIYSEASGYHIGIQPNNVNTSTGGYWKINNLICYNLQTGVYLDTSGTTGGGPYANRRYIENCIFFNCGKSVEENYGYALILEYVGAAYIQALNISLLRNDSIIDHDLNYTDTTCTIDNCATTDETTFADIEAANPGVTTDCHDNFTASEHLKSTILGNDDFLRPKIYDGTGIYNGGTTPITPTTDYNEYTYGMGGIYPIGPFQWILDLSENTNPIIRFESAYLELDVDYPNRCGIEYHNEILSNPLYSIANRDFPTTEIAWNITNLNKSNRDSIWDLWFTNLSKGYNLFTLIDHRKRLLFDCIWDKWQEAWKKARGGIHDININIISPFSWTPPTFAFYTFDGTVLGALGDNCMNANNALFYGDGGSVSDKALILTEQGSAANAAYSTDISWFQKKDNSSISLLAQFRIGEIVNGAEIDIIKISDGNNTLKLYAINSAESSSSLSSSSSSLGLSSSSSQGLSSSSSQGLSSSSSQGLSSSSSSLATSSSSQGLSSSSSSEGLSSSSQGLSSSSSQGLSSSSSSLGLSSSSSQGLSSSEGLSSSSSSAAVGSSSSQGLSSSSSSQGLSSSSSSLGLSSSSSSEGLSSSSSQGLSSSSSQGLSSSSQGLSSSHGLSSSSSGGFSSSSSPQSRSESSSSLDISVSFSSESTSSVSSSSHSSSSISSSQSESTSSSQAGSAEITIGLQWTKSGESAEYISMDEVNTHSNGVRAWYDICGTFDNCNNQFHLYICRSGDTTKSWSYTFDYLYNTSTLSGIPENCLISDTSPTNYPEDVTWTSIYLLNGNQADMYVTDADKAELNYMMIIDEFIPPVEYNWIRRLFHYWNTSTGIWPK